MANIAESLISTGSLQTDVDIFLKLLSFGKEQGYISEDKSMPIIMELVSQASQICESVYNALNDNFKKDGSNVLEHINILFGWCVYMGLGITYLYNNNSGKLTIREMCYKIINERTVFAMDEYATDIIGMGYGSKESDEFTKHNQLLSQLCMLTIPTKSPDLIGKQMKYTSKALFDYGCTIEMDRLGM